MAHPAGFLYHRTSLWPVQYYQGFCWGCLFQGPFWFLRRRMPGLAAICLTLAIATLGLAWFVAPWFATRLQVAHLRQHGYCRLDELGIGRLSHH